MSAVAIEEFTNDHCYPCATCLKPTCAEGCEGTVMRSTCRHAWVCEDCADVAPFCWECSEEAER